MDDLGNPFRNRPMGDLVAAARRSGQSLDQGQMTRDKAINDAQKALERTPPIPGSPGNRSGSQTVSPRAPRLLRASYGSASELHDVYFDAGNTSQGQAPRRLPLQEALPRPLQLKLSEHVSAKPAADRVALTNARYLTADAGADQETVLDSEYGGLLQESHLMSIGAALSLLNDWINVDRNKAISLGANPQNIRSLRGAVSEHQSQVSGELDQMAGTQMEKLSLAFESLIAASKMGEDGAQRAVDCFIGFLEKETKSSRTARGWVGGKNGQVLRQALATRFLPSGWTVSVVDDRDIVGNKDLVGQALLASFSCGKLSFRAENSFN